MTYSFAGVSLAGGDREICSTKQGDRDTRANQAAESSSGTSSRQDCGFCLFRIGMRAAYACAINNLDRLQFPLSASHFCFTLVFPSPSHQYIPFRRSVSRLHPFFAIYCLFLLSSLILFASSVIDHCRHLTPILHNNNTALLTQCILQLY